MPTLNLSRTMRAERQPRMQDLPDEDRPRERLWARGADTLSDAELLALVLRSGRRGESALHLATRLLADFGGVRRIATAGLEELAAYPGVGPAKAASLVGALNLAGRAARPEPKRTPIKRPEDLASVAAEELRGARRERVVVLVLDSGHRLKRVVRVSDGFLDRSSLLLREVFSAVLRHDGKAFALAHNHPSGDPTPSAEDRKATHDLGLAARTLGLRFLDHVVVTDTAWESVLDGKTRVRRQTHGPEEQSIDDHRASAPKRSSL